MTTVESEYSVSEEIANSVTHMLGIVLGIAGMTLLIMLTASEGNMWKVASSIVYGTTLILLYTVSTLYHAFQQKKLKYLFKILDHSAIYLFIAGTYTVFTLVALRGPWGWSLFGIIWSLAAMGIIFKILFVGRFEALSVAIYLLMGWLVIIAMPPLITALPKEGLVWLTAGGVVYSIGVILYMKESIPFNHAIWHLFVLVGSACHYVAVFYCLLS